MKTLDIIVDSHLRVSADQMPADVMALVREALTVRDPEDEDAPPIIMYGGDSDGNVTMPRGFALKLKVGLRRLGISAHWIDNRVSVPIPEYPIREIEPRDYQSKAILRMGRVEQGIYEAPPGSGKTVSACCFIARARQRTLIIVDKINIVTQWRDEWENVTGTVAGQIGDGVVDVDGRDVVVTTRQGLWAYREQFDNTGWWSQWGMIMLDECHAISSPTTRDLIQRFPAKYRFGLSATPDRDKWLTMASRSIIGEIFCRTTEEELEAAGVLVKPRVMVMRTPFEFHWKRRGDPKRQWQTMIKSLRDDPPRNSFIANLFAMQRGHTCLVHTDQKGHAYTLAGHALAAGWPDESVLMLTGDQSNEERSDVIRRASEGNCIIFSTIGQEAMNIPRLNRFFLVWPSKKEYAIKQMLGRIMRTHYSKTDPPIIFDLLDANVWILNNQFAQRRGVYDRLGLRVDFVQ